MQDKKRKKIKKIISAIVKFIIASGLIFLFTDIILKYLFTFTY